MTRHIRMGMTVACGSLLLTGCDSSPREEVASMEVQNSSVDVDGVPKLSSQERTNLPSQNEIPFSNSWYDQLYRLSDCGTVAASLAFLYRDNRAASDFWGVRSNQLDDLARPMIKQLNTNLEAQVKFTARNHEFNKSIKNMDYNELIFKYDSNCKSLL